MPDSVWMYLVLWSVPLCQHCYINARSIWQSGYVTTFITWSLWFTSAEVDWVTKSVCRDVVVFHIKDYGLKLIYFQSAACSHTYAVLSYLLIALSSEERRCFIWNGNLSSWSLKTTWVCANYANALTANPAGPGIAQTPTKKWNMGPVAEWRSSLCLYGFTSASSCRPKTYMLGSLVILHQEFKQK